MCATIATAQQPNWSLHNSIVDYQNTSLSSLPGSPNPEYTQNALWDDHGNLICHEADGKIWDSQGNLVLKFEKTIGVNTVLVKGFTEFVFIPVPGVCNVTGLDPLTVYRISMTINADPQYACPSMGTITETLNTGGRIGTFSGEAISNQNVEQ
jgi:hypothetical protein